MTVKDFDFVKVVGKGSFGKVMMVRKIDSGKIYAMKVLKKKALVKRKRVVQTVKARQMLAGINHPFVVSLHWAFQTDAKLYMVLDHFNGGELFFHLKKEGRFSERRSKFYGGEICLGLECIHQKDIVYVDLQPENIILDMDGHIKITDFTMDKDSLGSDSMKHEFCGKPEYLAPEIAQQKPYTFAADWWSFGTLLYEMMTGSPPFYSENVDVMYERIVNAPTSLPKYLSQNARSIFLKLLEKDPKQRLGSERDAAEIKQHEFFKDLDMKQLLEKKIKPPFKPKVADEEDTAYVQDHLKNEIAKDTLAVQTGSVLSASAQDKFVGFTYNETDDGLS